MAGQAKGLWKDPKFRRFWLARIASNTGSGITTTVVPVIVVVTLHASTAALGILNALGIFPALVLGIPAGIWVDRRRRTMVVMVAADLICCASVLAIPALYHFHLLSLAAVLGSVALTNVVTLLFQHSAATQMPLVVEHEGNMTQAVSLLKLQNALGTVGGPTFAGALLAVIAAPFALLVDAASYLVSAFNLSRINTPPRQPEQTDHRITVRTYTEPLKWLYETRELRRFTAAYGTAVGLAGALFAVYPYLAIRDLLMSPGEYAGSIAMLGVGGVVAAFSAPRVIERLGQRRAVLLGLSAFPIIAIVLTVLRVHGPLAFAFASLAWFVVGLLSPIADIVGESWMFRHVRGERLGRVNGGLTTFLMSGQLLGALGAGMLAAAIGVRAVLWVLTVASILLFVATRMFPPIADPTPEVAEVPVG